MCWLILISILFNSLRTEGSIIFKRPSESASILNKIIIDGVSYVSLNEFSDELGGLKIEVHGKRYKVMHNNKTAYLFEDSNKIILENQHFLKAKTIRCEQDLCVPVDALGVMLTFFTGEEAEIVEAHEVMLHGFVGITNNAILPAGKSFGIVLDAGHGGEDPGAVSEFGLREKDITLDIMLALGEILEEKGFSVAYTRTEDLTLPLPYRIGVANGSNSSIFLSIHANFSKNHLASGLEVFFLNSEPTDTEAYELALRENEGTETGDITALIDAIVHDVERSSIISTSKTLAGFIYSAAERVLATKRGVKQAPFYVLSSIKKPAVLVEVGFLSNRMESRLLEDYKYREKIAEVLSQGIIEFVNNSGGISDVEKRTQAIR